MRRSLALLLLFAQPAYAQPVSPDCDPASTDAAASLVGDVAAAAATLAGPVPDFAPMAGIVVHAAARNVANPFATAITDALGDRLVVSSLDYTGRGHGDPNYVWARDYHPLYVRRADGSLKVVSYLSQHPVRNAYANNVYVPVTVSRFGARPDPATAAPAEDPLFRVPGDSGPGRRLKHEVVPLLMEGGNVVSTGKHVLISEKIIEDNSVERAGPPHLLQKGYKARSREETIATLAAALEVKPEDVIVVPALPGEKTKHVDLFLMPVSENEIVIPEIRDEAIDTIGYGHEKDLGRKAKAHLDSTAASLAEKGYTVTRLPIMPAVYLAKPRPMYSGQPVPDEWFGNYYSPANSVLANVKGEKKAFVPTFSASGFPEEYRSLKTRYEDEWVSALAARGWDATKVDATELGKASGLFHCITAVIPE